MTSSIDNEACWRNTESDRPSISGFHLDGPVDIRRIRGIEAGQPRAGRVEIVVNRDKRRQPMIRVGIDRAQHLIVVENA